MVPDRVGSEGRTRMAEGVGENRRWVLDTTVASLLRATPPPIRVISPSNKFPADTPGERAAPAETVRNRPFVYDISRNISRHRARGGIDPRREEYESGEDRYRECIVR